MRLQHHCAFLVALLVLGQLQEAGTALVRRRRAESGWSIGVLVLVDYALWKQWHQESNSNTASEEDIEFYFTHLMKKINNYYSSISDYDLEVVLQDIHISKTAESSPWTERLKLPPLAEGGRGVVDADRTLKTLRGWLERRVSTYDEYDHLMLFTGYDLYTPQRHNKKDTSRVGTAAIASLCGDSTKISVIEDRRDFGSALIAAHELAHNLNANHDKEQNTCSTTDVTGTPYVMAAFVEASTNDGTSRNRFSSCSVSQMEVYINGLTRKGRNCLSSPAPVFSESRSRRILDQAPGMRFTLAEQCTRVFGGPARYCGPPEKLAEVCMNLICVLDGGSIIDCARIAVPAFDGTPCGNKQWCLDGKCEYDSAAPAARENCVLGDFIWPIKLGNTDLKCDDPRIEPLCYNSDVRTLCCASCEQFRDILRPDCEYGDRSKGCVFSQCNSSSGYRLSCCRTCAHHVGPRSSQVIVTSDRLLTVVCTAWVLTLVGMDS